MSINQYLALSVADLNTAIWALPLFVMDDQGEYIVKVLLDDDGDITGFEGDKLARLRLSAVTPKRSERLAHELMEAVRAIVDPPKGGGSKKPSTTEPEPPPPG